MSTIVEYYKQAELALASYAILEAGILDSASVNALKIAGMSEAQASDFASKWTVIDQFDSITGVSATVFQENTTGQRYLAIRGTQGLTDYLADYYILNGTPSALNPQYQALKTQMQDWLSDGTLTSGFTVSGHSLGGYLAAGLVADFSTNISQAYLYNAPGNNSIISQIAQALGWSNTPDSSKIISLQADAGISPIAGLGFNFSAPITINIENQFLVGVSNPPLAMNHSQQVLTDSLALYQTFSQLIPTASISQIGEIFKKASNANELTLEKTFDALRTLVLGKSTVDAIPTMESNRDSFFANLYQLQNSESFKSLIGKTTITAPPTSAAEARNGFGAFLSLFYLTPFALNANNAEANNLLLAIHTALGDKWTNDYNLSDEAKQNGEANFSDLWLADRAAMLSWVNLRNKYDIETSAGQQVANNGLPNALEAASQRYYFQDMASGTEVYLGTSEDRRKFIFGSNEADTVEGDDYSDHLYGMDGNDTVNGNNGNDYIEGNAGQDSLNGGEGNDVLLGGTEEDVLDGNAGNDQLKGGAGVDVYQFNGAFGTDVIIDSDGQGSLIADSNPLVGGDKKLENIYKHEGTGYIYSRVNDGKTILVTKEGNDNRIIINNWSEDKNLNISLSGEMPAAPNATPGLTGDFKKKIDDKGTPSTDDDTYVMTEGNYTPDGDEADALDLISGTAANDVINGLGGDDALSGREGDDYIEGGNGTDVIQGGLGKDTIKGGDGHDIIYGSSDDPLIKPTNVDFEKPGLAQTPIKGYRLLRSLLKPTLPNNL